MTTRSFYDDPSIYDILHAPGTAREVDGLERMAGRFVARGVSRGRAEAWLEPACGTGRYLRLAARRGRRVIGFDLSEGMIAYARERVRGLGPEVAWRATLFVADMMTFDAAPELQRGRGGRGPRITFAFNLINTFRHLETDQAALAHLRAMRSALAPGGVYAVGLSLSAYGREQPSEDVWEAQRGKVAVRQVAQYHPPPAGGRLERVQNIVVVQRPGREDVVITSKYRLRTYSRGQFERLAQRAGFEVVGHVDEDGRDVEVVEGGYGVWALR